MHNAEIIKILEHQIKNVKAGHVLYAGIQYLHEGEWCDVLHVPKLDINESPLMYRIKPRCVDVNGEQVPKPEQYSLMIGMAYYIPNPNHVDYYEECYWKGLQNDYLLLNRGIVHLHREYAITHCKAMLKYYE